MIFFIILIVLATIILIVNYITTLHCPYCHSKRIVHYKDHIKDYYICANCGKVIKIK